jgi:hypothetical protein
MSTRSVIAKPEGDGWKGVYCHWDGYPTHRGKQVWAAFHELGSADALREYAIREKGYWSSFAVPSTTRAGDWVDQVDDQFVDSQGDDCGTEWCYVIGDRELYVLDRRWGTPNSDDGKMVGMFGCGADAGKGYWKLVGTYPWDGDEPNWEKIEGNTETEDDDGES